VATVLAATSPSGPNAITTSTGSAAVPDLKPDPDKVKLLFGPYVAPALRLGSRTHCLYRDRLVIVHGWSDARISWPTCRNAEGRGAPGLLVEEELARAVRGESVLALKHWWGVSQTIAWRWRKALGAERYNPGSERLRRMTSATGAEANRGVPRPDAAERMRQAHQERDLTKGIQPCPRPNGAEPWTPEEDALLRTLAPAEAATRTGRTLRTVHKQRSLLGLTAR
jgi:hypothetical protein